jgi:hypothetical protein
LTGVTPMVLPIDNALPATTIGAVPVRLPPVPVDDVTTDGAAITPAADMVIGPVAVNKPPLNVSATPWVAPLR